MNLVLVLILVLTLVLILILILVLTLVLVLTLILTLVLTLVLVLVLVLVLTRSSSSSGSGSIYDYNSNSDPNPNPNPNLIPNPNPNLIPNPNLNPSSEVLTRCCNKCNYIKPLNNFDEGKYTCRSCTSAKVNCPYCTSVVRYDGIRAHVEKQHPDIELTRGFSRNITDRCNCFADKTINPSWQSPRAVSPLVINQTEDLRSSFTDNCSCKYYNLYHFL